MKKRLNLLCIVIFLVLGGMLFKTGYDFGFGIYTGMQIARENMTELKESKKKGKQPVAFISNDFREVDLIPAKAIYKPDSIRNEMTDQIIPIMYVRAMVDTGKKTTAGGMILQGSLMLLSITSMIAALIYFIKLIVSINRMVIFDWINVKRLRKIGYALRVFFSCSFIPQLSGYFNVVDNIKLENYVLLPTLDMNASNLFLGLGCLIVAEIFAIGLKMKEEQELTI